MFLRFVAPARSNLAGLRGVESALHRKYSSNPSIPTAPVDPLSGKKGTHRVYATEEPWDVILNQTDVNANQNKNKFYIIQLLQCINDPDSLSVYARWGRVGEQGQTRVDDAAGSVSDAQKLFSKKFKLKTGVEWAERETATPMKGKYMWLDREYEAEEGDANHTDVPPSTLAPEVQTLCNLIFSQSLIEAHLAAMNYNSAKMPLGKLGKSTILKGFSALKRVAEVIENPDGDAAKEHGGADAAYAELSGAYYSIIPHAFGRVAPVIINNAALLKQELDLMDSLSDMAVASTIMGAKTSSSAAEPVNPMDARFLALGLSSIVPVARDSREFRAVDKYARDTEVRNSHCDLAITSVFGIERESETAAWVRAGHDRLDDGERLLLWHGSRSTNFAGILKEGLRIAPPEAPSTGYMFGRGIYFADMVSKSLNYCHAYLSENNGLLLLCEVAAGPFYEQSNSNYGADIECRAANKRSTKGLGRSAPARWTDAGVVLDNDALRGCMMPAGRRRLRTVQPALHHNEYIVYNLDQIRLRYLVMVDSKPRS
ncbi:PARP-domain-containing protein [Mycena sp. CBHHK59/15]|nr:PARP-domain-containing protein [Mycena sp. CBHHK59/15]